MLRRRRRVRTADDSGSGRRSNEDLVLTEEQELCGAPRRTSPPSLPVSRIRRLRDTATQRLLAGAVEAHGRLGWPGIVLPEAYGGLGLGYAELSSCSRSSAGSSRPSRSSRPCCSPATRSCSAAGRQKQASAGVASRRHDARARVPRAGRAPSPAPRRGPVRAGTEGGGCRRRESRTWCSRRRR